MDFEIYVNVKFNVFTKASNDCDPIVDDNDAPSGAQREIFRISWPKFKITELHFVYTLSVIRGLCKKIKLNIHIN